MSSGNKPNFLGGGIVQRDAHLRRESTDNLFQAESPRFLPFLEVKACLDKDHQPLLLDRESAEPLLEQAKHCIFLGKWENGNVFALDMDGAFQDRLSEMGAANFVGLRVAAFRLPSDPASLLAYGSAMIKWHRRHGFCSNCGELTRVSKQGHVRVCDHCGTQHFPRLDPAIIVLVTNGEKCLLGRQPSWDTGRYSTIAGFVEPGESLEDAVIREVMEETGISTQDIRYHSSQPWPFPSSLMLGFYAKAASFDIRLGDDELEDAQWFSKDDIKNKRVGLPFPVSISFRLIEEWFDQNEPVPLRQLIQSGQKAR